MFPLKRCSMLGLVLLLAAGDASAHSWLNELLVHRTPSYTEEGEKACLVCHAGAKMRAVNKGVHGNHENPLTPFSKHQCESCHGPGSIHVSRAHGGKGFPALIEFGAGPRRALRDKQVGACLSCHENGDIGMEVTTFTGTTHDRWLVSCPSCHQVHVESDPILERKQQPGICLACHIREETEHPKVGNRVPDFSRMGCAGCHRVHRLPRAEQSED